METTSQHPEKASKRKCKFRVVKWVAISLAAVVLLLIVIIPPWLSSESGKNLVLSKINELIEGKVDIDDLSVGWFKGVNLTDVTYADTEGAASLSVKSITTRPKLKSMLKGNLALGKTVVDSPKLVINVEEPEPADLSKASVTGKSDDAEAALPLSMLDLKVTKGNATINLTSDDRVVQSVEFSNIESNVNLNPLGKESTFDLEMEVAQDHRKSKVTAEGSLKRPKKKWTLKGTSGNFKVNVDNLDLSSLTPLFALAGKDIKTDGMLNADADIKISKGRLERVVTKAELTDFKRTIGEKQMVLDEPVVIDADISTSDDAILIDSLKFNSSFCTVRCQGTGDVVDFDARANLGGLQDFAGQFTDFGEYDFAGDVSTKGKATFGADGVKLTGSGLAERLTIDKGDVKTPATTANIVFDIQRDSKKEITKINSARILADPGTIEIANSTIPFDPAKGDVNLDVRADVDLKKFQPFAALIADMPEGIKLAGRFASEASVTAKDGSYHIVTDKTSIKNLSITSPDSKPFEQETVNLIADVIYTSDENEYDLNVNRFYFKGVQDKTLIEIEKGKISKTTARDKTRIRGDIQARYDLAAVSAMAFAYLPPGLSMEGDRSTRLTFDSEYREGTDQFLENLNAKTSLGFNSAHYKGMYFGKADMALNVNNGLASFDLPPTTVNEGKVAFAGNINFREKPATFRMSKPTQIVDKVKINDEMGQRMLRYINPLFANQTEITGSADFHCEKMSIPLGADTSRNDIEIVGTVDMRDVVLKPKDLLGQLVPRGGIVQVMPTRFVVRDGWVSYEDMPVHVDKYPLNFKGRIGLDERVEMTVVLPLTLALKTARVGESDARIPLPLTGTLDKIEVDFSRVPEEAGKEILRQKLPEELEKIFRKGNLF